MTCRCEADDTFGVAIPFSENSHYRYRASRLDLGSQHHRQISALGHRANMPERSILDASASGLARPPVTDECDVPTRSTR